eukprot:7082141-Karenia_brevis.AAC.1
MGVTPASLQHLTNTLHTMFGPAPIAESQSGMSTFASSYFPLHSVVRVQGLVSQPALNGKQDVVIFDKDSKKVDGRVAVKMQE